MIHRPIHGVGYGRYNLFTKPFLDGFAELIPWAFQVLCHRGHGLFIPVMITRVWGPMVPFFPTEGGICVCPVVSWNHSTSSSFGRGVRPSGASRL